MSATPWPWYVDGDGMICGPLAEVVVGLCEDEDEAQVPSVYKEEDRALIVRCVNAYDALVKALRDLVDNPIVRGMSARIRAEAKERGVPDAYVVAEAALEEAGAE